MEIDSFVAPKRDEGAEERAMGKIFVVQMANPAISSWQISKQRQDLIVDGDGEGLFYGRKSRRIVRSFVE